MAISETDVRHIAKLANLALSDAEITRMSGELGAIVGYIEQLRSVTTDGVEPIANVAGLTNIVRTDTPVAMLSAREVLANAPLSNEVAILVPKAVER